MAGRQVFPRGEATTQFARFPPVTSSYTGELFYGTRTPNGAGQTADTCQYVRGINTTGTQPHSFAAALLGAIDVVCGRFDIAGPTGYQNVCRDGVICKSSVVTNIASKAPLAAYSWWMGSAVSGTSPSAWARGCSTASRLSMVSCPTWKWRVSPNTERT